MLSITSITLARMTKVQLAVTTLSTTECIENRLSPGKVSPIRPKTNPVTGVLLICLFLLLSLGIPSRSRADTWPVTGRGNLDLNSVDVRMIQYLLRNQGLSVAVDGRFGVQTQQRVRQFQLSRGLAVTGKVDGPTWKQLIVILHLGDHGDAVRAMQSSLQQYDERLFIDGRFGRRTMRSLRAFQKLMHLPGNDAVGPLTWQRLTDPLPD